MADLNDKCERLERQKKAAVELLGDKKKQLEEFKGRYLSKVGGGGGREGKRKGGGGGGRGREEEGGEERGKKKGWGRRKGERGC